MKRVKSAFRIDKNSFLFFVAYGIFVTMTLFRTTFLYQYVEGTAFKAGLGICVLIIALNELITGRGPRRMLTALIIAIGYIGLAVFVQVTQYLVFAATVIFIFAAREIPFRRIARFSAILLFAILCIVILLSQAGIIRDFILDDGYGRIRHYLGFRYALYPSTVIMNVTMLVIYLRRKNILWIELLVITLINVWIFMKTGSRLSFALSLAIIAVGAFLKIWPTFMVKKKKFKYLLTMSFIVLAAFSLLASTKYDASNETHQKINSVLSNRLKHQKKAMDDYGFSLFGNDFDMYGNGLNSEGKLDYNEDVHEYFYIDNNYVSWYVRNGFVFFVLMLAVCTAMAIRSVRYDKYGYMLIIMVFMSVFCVIQDTFLSIHYNTFILAAGNLLMNKKTEEEIELEAGFTPAYRPKISYAIREKVSRRVKLHNGVRWGGGTVRTAAVETSSPAGFSGGMPSVNKQGSLKLNFIMNAILTMSTFIFPLITFPYVSRVLLEVGTGKVSFATSVITYFNMFAQLGIPTYGIRACARVRDDREELSRTAHELLIINVIMSAVSYVLLAAGIIFVPKLQNEKTLLVITSLTIILSAIGMEWLFKALEQYTYITVRSVIFKIIAIIAMFFLVREQKDYVIYGAITIFAASASNIMNFIHARKFIQMRPVGGYDLKRHLKAVMIFFAMACATTIYTNLDVVMLGFMKTDGDVGYYNAAVRIKTILVSIVTSLGAVLLPRASYYIEHDMKDEFKRITGKALNFVFLSAAPLALYFVFYAREGILFLAGNAFEGSVLPMQIIMPTLLLIGITNILGIQILVPLGREKVVLVSEIAGAVTDVILNAIFIPRYASSGAAFGTLVAEVVVLVVQAVALRKEIGYAFRQISYVKILLGMVIAFASCFWVKFLKLGNFVSLIISSVLFFGIYLMFMYIINESLTREIIDQLVYKIKSIIKRS